MLGTIVSVIGTATLTPVPIEVAALLGCVFLFLTNCLRTQDGYNSIQWNLLFIIFGMLGMGLAMEETGATKFLAHYLTQGVDS